MNSKRIGMSIAGGLCSGAAVLFIQGCISPPPGYTAQTCTYDR
jgi:hypothetical protein